MMTGVFAFILNMEKDGVLVTDIYVLAGIPKIILLRICFFFNSIFSCRHSTFGWIYLQTVCNDGNN